MRALRSLGSVRDYSSADFGHRAKAVEDADLVIEAIIESLKVKRDLFGFLDDKAKSACISPDA